METNSLETPLEEEIRKQVGRVGKTVAGEFNEATEQEAVKYHVKVHQSVNLLESLCIPLIDEDYTDKKEELLEEEKSQTGRRTKGQKNKQGLLSEAKTKYRLLVELLHRKGVL